MKKTFQILPKSFNNLLRQSLPILILLSFISTINLPFSDWTNFLVEEEKEEKKTDEKEVEENKSERLKKASGDNDLGNGKHSDIQNSLFIASAQFKVKSFYLSHHIIPKRAIYILFGQFLL